MIGTNLAPGTPLICIDAAPRHVPVPLIKGELYHLRGYTQGPTGYIAVLLVESRAPQLFRALMGMPGEDGYCRDRFRLLNIPKCFTDMLDAANNNQRLPVNARVKDEIIFYPDGSIEVRGILVWDKD